MKLLKLNAICIFLFITSSSVAISIICSVGGPLLSPAISIHKLFAAELIKYFNNDMRTHSSPCQDQVILSPATHALDHAKVFEDLRVIKCVGGWGQDYLVLAWRRVRPHVIVKVFDQFCCKQLVNADGGWQERTSNGTDNGDSHTWASYKEKNTYSIQFQ